MSDETSLPRKVVSPTLAIKIEPALRQRIKDAAGREYRSESSFVRYHLEQAAQASELVAAEKHQPEGEQ